jgi:hypothetical protein
MMASTETPNVTEIRLSHPIDNDSPKDSVPDSGIPQNHSEVQGLPRAKFSKMSNKNIPNFPSPNIESQKVLGSYLNASELGSEYTNTNIRKPRMEPSGESNYDKIPSHEVKNALGHSRLIKIQPVVTNYKSELNISKNKTTPTSEADRQISLAQ